MGQRQSTGIKALNLRVPHKNELFPKQMSHYYPFDYDLSSYFVQATRKASIFIQGGVIACEQMRKAKITGVDAMLQNML